MFLGERVGAFSVVCANDKEVKAVDSQIKIIIRCDLICSRMSLNRLDIPVASLF